MNRRAQEGAAAGAGGDPAQGERAGLLEALAGLEEAALRRLPPGLRARLEAERLEVLAALDALDRAGGGQ